MNKRQQYIEDLRFAAHDLGHHPSVKEWRDGGYSPSVSSLCRTFGSWNEAKEAAGLDTLGQGKLRFDGVFMYVDQDGYVRVRHQHEGEREQFRLHRLIAVAEYGFDVVAGNVVHHGAGPERSTTPWDNRPENLAPMDHGEHSRLHATEEAKAD